MANKFYEYDEFIDFAKSKIIAALDEINIPIADAIDEESESGIVGDGAGSADLLEWYQDFLVSDAPQLIEDELTEMGFYSSEED